MTVVAAHVNDFEGVTLLVEKTNGSILGVQAQAHDDFTWTAGNAVFKVDLNGWATLFRNSAGTHPVVLSQVGVRDGTDFRGRKGHGAEAILVKDLKVNAAGWPATPWSPSIVYAPLLPGTRIKDHPVDPRSLSDFHGYALLAMTASQGKTEKEFPQGIWGHRTEKLFLPEGLARERQQVGTGLPGGAGAGTARAHAPWAWVGRTTDEWLTTSPKSQGETVSARDLNARPIGLWFLDPLGQVMTRWKPKILPKSYPRANKNFAWASIGITLLDKDYRVETENAWEGNQFFSDLGGVPITAGPGNEGTYKGDIAIWMAKDYRPTERKISKVSPTPIASTAQDPTPVPNVPIVAEAKASDTPKETRTDPPVAVVQVTVQDGQSLSRIAATVTATRIGDESTGQTSARSGPIQTSFIQRTAFQCLGVTGENANRDRLLRLGFSWDCRRILRNQFPSRKIPQRS